MGFKLNVKKVVATVVIIGTLLSVMLIFNVDKPQKYEIMAKSSNDNLIIKNEIKELENVSDVEEISAEVVVYISGAVKSPSVVTLIKGSRLNDAVNEAGGLSENADLEAVNLAMEISDGNQYIIPAKGEALLIVGESFSDDKEDGLININKADEKELTSLIGVGAVLAGRIVEYRDTNGDFKSVEEIKSVTGIGDKKFEDIKNDIKI